jgi:hypothetical protein
MSGDATVMDERWRAISTLNLNADVPEAISHHFETAKNVLLYAWFVYRFHMVAEQYVLTTLELALRERLLRENHIKIASNTAPGLKWMLSNARKEGWISNKRFAPGRQMAQQNAEFRHSLKMIHRMEELELHEMEYDLSAVEIAEEDLAHNWIEQFESDLPSLRNMHAHGTKSLYPTVFTTFRIVHNLIEQLFPVNEL